MNVQGGFLMKDKREMIHNFFPTELSRERAFGALGAEVSQLLSKYPASLVQKVQQLKASGMPLKKISEALDRDPRIPEIAMHLAVKKQAEEIGSFDDKRRTS